jgi:hypothetical protein
VSARHREACRRSESIVTALLAGDDTLAAQLIRSDHDPRQLAWAALRMLATTFASTMLNRGDDPREAWSRHLITAHQRRGGG